MHIEPGVVEGSKIVLSFLTAGGVGAYALSSAWKHIKERGSTSLIFGAFAATAMVLVFFQVFPRFPVGVSEVHLILGSTLFLLFGAAPAAFGLAVGLLIQGMFFAPFDLPQYGMNVTTLLVPLFALQYVAGRTIAPKTPYVDLKYRQALGLSATYQAGIVSWVSFWVFYGQGFSVESVSSIAAFGVAYMTVILLEPLADLAVLAGAKALRRSRDDDFKDDPRDDPRGDGALLEPRLFAPA